MNTPEPTPWPPDPHTPTGIAWRTITDNLNDRTWTGEDRVLTLAMNGSGIDHTAARLLLQQALRDGRLDGRTIKNRAGTRREIRLTEPTRDPGGDIYHQAVAHRGGHEYTGGPLAWDHPEGEHQPCTGCPLCTNRQRP